MIKKQCRISNPRGGRKKNNVNLNENRSTDRKSAHKQKSMLDTTTSSLDNRTKVTVAIIGDSRLKRLQPEKLKIRLKSLLVLRTRGNHPTSRKSANEIAASNPPRRNRSFLVKCLVPSQNLKWMLKYCSYFEYFLINRLQRNSSRVVYIFRQISYLEPELRAVVFTLGPNSRAEKNSKRKNRP